MPVYAYDPRARYLSGPRRRTMLRALGLGDVVQTDDSSLSTTLTPPPDLPLPQLAPMQVAHQPIPFSDSPLSTTLTPPPAASPTGAVSSSALVAAASAANARAGTSFWNRQTIPGVSNTMLVAGVAGIFALTFLSGGRRRR